MIIYGCLDTSVPNCVTGDAGRIRQILNNLLSNAIKFTDSGHVVARLRAQAMPDARVRLDLQVADSGIGIAAAQQAKLFEPFHQAAAGTQAARGAGLGLGLFLCARLAALMGTRIQVISEPGLGSSFSISFMVDRADALAYTPPLLQGLSVLVRSAARKRARAWPSGCGNGGPSPEPSPQASSPTATRLACWSTWPCTRMPNMRPGEGRASWREAHAAAAARSW